MKKLLQLSLASLGLAWAISATISIPTATANPMVLSETQVNQNIKTLSGWTTDGKKIARTFNFKNFVEAIDFVNRLVEPAESAGHHPDIAISYNKVTISLTTHDAGGLTQKDFDLARVISDLAP